MLWRAGPGIALAALTACGGTNVLTLDLSAEDGVGFVIRVDESGESSLAAGPFGLEDGRLIFGARPQLSTSPGLDYVLLVPTAALEAAVPGWSMGEGRDVGLTLSPPTTQLRLLPDGRLRTSTGLPEATRFWRVDEEAARRLEGPPSPLSSRLSLEVSFDPEHCRPQAQTEMTAWGGAGPLDEVRDGGERPHLNNVAIIDADRLLTHSYGTVYALQRGLRLRTEDIDSGPPFLALTASTATGLGRRAQVADVEVDPRTLEDPTVLIVVTFLGSDGGFGSAIVRARFADEGLVDVQTATVAPGLNLREVAVAPDGAWLAAGDQGVLFGHFDGGEITRGPTPPLFGDTGHSVASNPDRERPWLVSGENQLHTFDATRGRWSTQPIQVISGETLRFRGMAAGLVEGQPQAWAGSAGGRLYVTDAGAPWVPRTLQIPPRIGACTEQVGVARPAYTLSVDDMRIADEVLYVASDACSAILQVRLTDLCTSVLALGDIRGGDDFAEGLDVQDGLLIVVGEEGAIWEAPTR